MPAISAMVSDRAELHVTIGNETVRIVYRPNQFTPAREQELLAATADDKSETGPLVTAVIDSIAEWDLKWNEHDSMPIPLEREHVSRVPVVILARLLDDIGKDLSGKAGRNVSG